MNEAIREAAREAVAKEGKPSEKKPEVNSASRAALAALRAAETDEQEVEALRLLVDSLK